MESSWFERHPKTGAVVVLIICLAVLEAIARLAVWADLLPYQTHPTSRQPQYWASIDPVTGIWRFPNRQFHHREKCMDETYTSNSVGMRDRERTLESENFRVVLLGDSFVEGFGVPDGARFADMLEQDTGLEHLNFGSGGHFGTIQSWLTYTDKATHYEHSAVYFFILPSNDFRDNNPESFKSNEYRPFLRPVGDAYEVWYPVGFSERDQSTRSFGHTLKNRIDNSVYLLNVIRSGFRSFKAGTYGAESTVLAPSYQGYSDEDLAILEYTLAKTIEAAGSRPVYLFVIPGVDDFDFARQQGADFELISRLEAFAAQYKRVTTIDLLPYFLADAEKMGRAYRDYTLGCDGHWSEAGHRVAADAVATVTKKLASESGQSAD